MATVLSVVLIHLLAVCYAVPFFARRLKISIESRLDAMTGKHKQGVIANEYRNCEQNTQKVIISTLYPLSCFVSRNDVSDDENANEPLVQVSGNPFLPMGYGKNVNLHTFTGL